VLCNAEVIDVDQDALGKQARIVRRTDDEFILAKPMADGSLAVGLFNLADAAREVSVTWQDLGIQGRRRVRDVWRQEDTPTVAGEYKAVLPRHGVALLRLFR
jgi:alpha-galactosidase